MAWRNKKDAENFGGSKNSLTFASAALKKAKQQIVL